MHQRIAVAVALSIVLAACQEREGTITPTKGPITESVYASGVVKAALAESGKNFLHIVIENGRVDALPEIAAQFRALKNAQSGSADATVYSAFPMDDKAIAEMSSALEKRFGRKLNITVELDASLIGGIRVVVGDEVLDTSVKARLDQMKIALTA